jgi:hypothetical protein
MRAKSYIVAMGMAIRNGGSFIRGVRITIDSMVSSL